jgi:ribonuclease HI
MRHLLFTCPVAVDMWHIMGIHEIIEDALNEDREGSAVLENVINRADNSLQGFQSVNYKEVVLTICWYLWWMRRRRTNGESVPPLHKCKFSILSIVANAAKAYGKKLSNMGDRWARPENRQTKLNVDASFHNDSKMGAVGAVLRDFQGQFVAASAKVLANVESVVMAEAHAMKEGLSLAVTLGCNNVIAESDSIDVIQACTGADSWWSESSAIFADCVDMAVSIGRVNFSHISRDANQVAHTLARESSLHNISCTWVDEPPSFLLDKLLGDVTLI